ncbi:uncharacterized protein VICG_00127 [Vittaforma corneae ATCC 50505]|uniref:LsmAD domain-containing protein n=1 Tax=Vittaforma corneae (strain ATCC 50505) TaxID=993615 RepID=L2GR62_VITCO|nr:uncharacterized protein VICG_00127 [Vittaforma corneae ATCC 50505]ELA42812.1 hypothetical protein VICG_00127 [Vittaforma corneae ATCC 50505]
MVYDICLKIRDLGDIYGSFVKSTIHSIYLSNAILSKSAGVSISLFKIEKKYVITVSRMAAPSFDNFTDEQLQQVIVLKNPAYTQAAQKILESRKKSTGINDEARPSTVKTSKVESQKTASIKASGSAQQEKKEWDQFEANRKLFGVEPTFDVDEYACTIDRSAPEYTSTEAQAEKIAKELASDTSCSRKKSEVTEDMLYSTVRPTEKWDMMHSAERLPAAATEVVPVSKTAELKKQLESIDKEITQSYQDFQKEGWNAIAKLLNKKKTITNELEALSNPTAKQEMALPSKEEVPNKIKKDVESPSKQKTSTHDGNEGIQAKPQKSKERPAQGAKKHTQNEQKHQKQSQVETPAKFNSASEIIELIIKNFSSVKQQEHKHSWCDVQNLKENPYVHLKPLESFDFPASKVQEIQDFQKTSSERRFHLPKTFK